MIDKLLNNRIIYNIVQYTVAPMKSKSNGYAPFSTTTNLNRTQKIEKDK